MPYKTVEAQMEKILNAYTKEIVQVSDKAFQSVAKDSGQKLKNESPKKTGDYAKG